MSKQIRFKFWIRGLQFHGYGPKHLQSIIYLLYAISFTCPYLKIAKKMTRSIQ